VTEFKVNLITALLVINCAVRANAQTSGTSSAPAPATESAAPTTAEPFSYADFGWLNGNSRQKTSVLDSKYFTGEFMADVNYVYDFAMPKDHTLDGSTNTGRTSEFQVEQLGVGGDFHVGHSRGRLMTQFGMYSTMTPRNDASPARGQWDLADAYRYISEAYGGYHWDVLNGINLDAGIFMSYIGLCSYYNNENWIYQMSYVSANTPWFFNGLRLQVFPTDRLKTEFWLINGWQSYGEFNEQPGLGMQTLWRPTENTSFVSNEYWGTDAGANPGRQRFHSDNSFQYKYLDKPANTISKAAFSITADAGCETGGGVACSGGDSANTPSQYFLGVMVYNRLWFDNDKFAFTIGGGAITNPGRYLVLLPPIQGTSPGATGGATASNNGCANCFTENAGDHFNAWDSSVTFDYMPDQSTTFRFEFIHRAADVPYFAGPGGMTSQDGQNTTTQAAGWSPDLKTTENRINLAMMVRY
jgi:hypothetical protein